jgi:photosystem II stability/assembly factor-like uncharacterized protein
MAKAGLLFVGTDDGLVLFSNPNNIGRWLRIGQPFRGHAVRAVWPVPENPLVVFAAVSEMGVQRSDDGGQSWREAVSLDAIAIAGHNSAPQIYMLGALGEVYRGDDTGEHWAQCRAGSAGRGTGALAVANADPRRVYVADSDGVWTSADSGDTWERFGEGAPANVVALAASPVPAGPVYAVAAGALYACATAASRWSALAGAPAAAGALAVLAGKSPPLLLAQSGGIARSDDGGATWAPAETAGEIAVIAPATYHIDTAFAGDAGGRLLASTDRGRTWETLKQDLPPIRSVAAARLV